MQAIRSFYLLNIYCVPALDKGFWRFYLIYSCKQSSKGRVSVILILYTRKLSSGNLPKAVIQTQREVLSVCVSLGQPPPWGLTWFCGTIDSAIALPSAAQPSFNLKLMPPFPTRIPPPHPDRLGQVHQKPQVTTWRTQYCTEFSSYLIRYHNYFPHRHRNSWNVSPFLLVSKERLLRNDYTVAQETANRWNGRRVLQRRVVCPLIKFKYKLIFKEGFYLLKTCPHCDNFRRQKGECDDKWEKRWTVYNFFLHSRTKEEGMAVLFSSFVHMGTLI